MLLACGPSLVEVVIVTVVALAPGAAIAAIALGLAMKRALASATASAGLGRTDVLFAGADAVGGSSLAMLGLLAVGALDRFGGHHAVGGFVPGWLAVWGTLLGVTFVGSLVRSASAPAPSNLGLGSSLKVAAVISALYAAFAVVVGSRLEGVVFAGIAGLVPTAIGIGVGRRVGALLA